MASLARLLVAWGLIALMPSAAKANVPLLGPIQHRLVELSVQEERLVIRNDGQWRMFWARFSSNQPPVVDLAHYDLVIVLMGTRPSGGYFVRIGEAKRKKANTEIELLFCSPPRGEAQIGEVTSPYDSKLIPKSSNPVSWRAKKGETGRSPCR